MTVRLYINFRLSKRIWNFYRTSYDATIAIAFLSVRPSVRPSVTRVDHVETVQYTNTWFLPYGTLVIRVFVVVGIRLHPERGCPPVESKNFDPHAIITRKWCEIGLLGYYETLVESRIREFDLNRN